MKRKVFVRLLAFVLCGVPCSFSYAADVYPVTIDGRDFENEDSVWEYLEETYPKVTISDVKSGDYTDSYVIIDTVAKNVDVFSTSEYVSCDMYFDKGDNAFLKSSLWMCFYDDETLKEMNFISGMKYLVNMQDNDLLEGCYYVNSDNSVGGTNLMAIRKIGTADETMRFTEQIYFDFSSSVPNDVTGKWRLSTTTTDLDITSYALNYYKAYFKSDDEIHAVINKKKELTSCLSIVAGQLNVAVHQYIENEEDDAKMLFGGDLIAQYYIDLETGDVEQIS